MATSSSVPIEWRELLIEVMFEAERRGLGTVGVEFTATPGHENQAADFIDGRTAHLSETRWS